MWRARAESKAMWSHFMTCSHARLHIDFPLINKPPQNHQLFHLQHSLHHHIILITPLLLPTTQNSPTTPFHHPFNH